MRCANKWLSWGGALVFLALAGFGVGSALGAEETDKKQEAIRQVNIMARVLENRLKEQLRGDLIDGSIFEPGGVRGFRVPGVGVVFLANVQFPLAERKGAEEKAEQVKDDLWSQIERGQPASPDPFETGGAMALGSRSYGSFAGDAKHFSRSISIELTKEDRRKIESLETVVLETLAKYGQRLTAIAPDERIVVLVGGRASGAVITRTTGFGGGGPVSSSVVYDDYDVARLLHDQVQEVIVDAPEVQEFQEEMQRMQRSLDEMAKEMEKVRDPDRIKEIVEAHKARIEAQRKRLEDLKSAKDPRAAVRRLRTVISTPGPGTAPRTTWVLSVKKSDLASDPDQLRKRAEIRSY